MLLQLRPEAAKQCEERLVSQIIGVKRRLDIKQLVPKGRPRDCIYPQAVEDRRKAITVLFDKLSKFRIEPLRVQPVHKVSGDIGALETAFAPMPRQRGLRNDEEQAELIPLALGLLLPREQRGVFDDLLWPRRLPIWLGYAHALNQRVAPILEG